MIKEKIYRAKFSFGGISIVIVILLIVTCFFGWIIIDNNLLKPVSERYPSMNYIIAPLFILAVATLVYLFISISQNGILKSVRINNHGVNLTYKKSILLVFNQAIVEKNLKWKDIDRIVYYRAIDVSPNFSNPDNIYLMAKGKTGKGKILATVSSGDFSKDMKNIKKDLSSFCKIEETWSPLKITRWKS